MAGILRNLSLVVTGTGAEGPVRNMFSSIVSFFDNHPAYSRIASNYGTPQYNFNPAPTLVQVAGLGFGPSGSATAVGDGAWAVYRKVAGGEVFDLFFGFSVADPSTNPSGSWRAGYFSTGFGMMWGWHSSSVAWSGSTNNNGQDTFTFPWKSDALLMPSANEKQSTTAGNYSLAATASRNAACSLTAPSWGVTENSFLLCVGDDDSFNIFWDAANQIYDNGIILERYIPFSSEYDLPYAMFGRSNVFNGLKVPRNYRSLPTSIASGITFRKPLAGRTGMTGSYSLKTDYPRWLCMGGPLISQRFGFTYTSASVSQSQAISEFPVHVGAGTNKKYGGHLSLFRVIEWTMPTNTVYGTSGSRYSLGFETGVGSTWASGSIPWSGSWTAHPSSSTNSLPSLWHTSSFPGIGYMPVTTSNLFEDETSGATLDVFYRGRVGGNYQTEVNAPPAGSSTAVILYTNYYPQP